MTGRFVNANGQRFAVYERAGMGRQVIFLHATGFHARCWMEVVRQLPEDLYCYAIDLRGHGLSSKPKPPYSWACFGEDVAALVRELHLTKVTGVGHSMGGHALAHAAALEPLAFSSLILIDPVLMPRPYYTGQARGPHFARKRRNRWASSEEMFEKFKDRAPFSSWNISVLRDYCRGALVPDGDDFILACPPDIEGSIYENSGGLDADIYDLLPKVKAPVTVVRSSAGPMSHDGPSDMSASPTAPDLAARFQNGKDMAVRYSHFIPMEAPELIADLARSAI